MYQTHTLFFFSSRRRHTRLQGDWSSDVCSSDLWLVLGPWRHSQINSTGRELGPLHWEGDTSKQYNRDKIGRASCRERIQTSVADKTIKISSQIHIEIQI